MNGTLIIGLVSLVVFVLIVSVKPGKSLFD